MAELRVELMALKLVGMLVSRWAADSVKILVVLLAVGMVAMLVVSKEIYLAAKLDSPRVE